MHFAFRILVLSSSVQEQDWLKDVLIGRDSVALLSWDGTSVFDGVDLICYFWFMQVNSFGKNEYFWFTRLYFFVSLKVQEIHDLCKWAAMTHSWRPIRWIKKLLPITVFTKSNIFTLGSSYPWPLHGNGRRRNLKDTKKWIRLDKESVFLCKMVLRLWNR